MVNSTYLRELEADAADVSRNSSAGLSDRHLLFGTDNTSSTHTDHDDNVRIYSDPKSSWLATTTLLSLHPYYITQKQKTTENMFVASSLNHF